MAKTYNAATSTLTGDRLNLYAETNMADKEVGVIDFSTVDPVAFATSCSIEVSADTIDTSNKMGGNWKNTLVGQLGWTVSCDALYSYDDTNHLSFKQLMDAYVNRTPVGIAIGIPAKTEVEFAQAQANGFMLDSTDTVVVKGKAYITSLSLNAGTGGEVASYSVSLTGDGKLYVGTTAAAENA